MNKSQDGFSLIEVLAALLLTSLCVPVFVQLFAIARGGDQVPLDVFAATISAENALASRSHAEGNDRSKAAFRTTIELSALRLTTNSDHIAPPIRSSEVQRTPPQLDVQAASSTSPSSSTAAPVSSASKTVRSVNVTVMSSSGRRTRFDGVATSP